ncbi:MAG: LLM class flavin-dependent oxidoreductase [Candidatus Kariarchaeaceae archaeon]|jgi:F420-dependent oxidoreductase-like protein
MSESDYVKVGVALSPDYYPVGHLLEYTPLLDKLGYYQISVPEIWGRDAISFLAAVAVKTKKVKLATGIISMFSRTPALVGMTAGTLDEMSNGRFVLGLGLSGPIVIENWHGLKYRKPLKRTEEFVKILRSIFNKERVNYDTSELGTLKGFRISNKNIRNNIPIHIASIGPKNVELTAEIADGWIPIFMPPDMFRSEIDKVRGMLEKHGRSFAEFEITPFIPSLIGNDNHIKDTLKAHLGYYFGGMGTFYNNLLKRMGFEDEAIEIMDLYQKGDVLNGNRAVSDDIVNALCITGSKEEAIEKLYEFHKIGISCPILAPPFRSRFDDVRITLETLAPQNIS